MPVNFGWRRYSSSSLRAASLASSSGTQPTTAPIQSCSAAWASIASVSGRLLADWTRTVRSTPAARSWGSSSAGVKVR